jgi:thioredoxin-related protein
MKFFAVFFILIAAVFFTQLSLAAKLPTEISGENSVTAKTETVRLGKGKKALVVVFLSSNCPCSMSHETMLKELSQTYSDFAFIGIHSNSDEGKTQAQEHFKIAALPFPVLQDQSSHFANLFGALKTPHVFVVNSEGKTLYQGGITNSHEAGRGDQHFLANALSDIQKGQAVRLTESRTLGCVIQRDEANAL